MPERTGPNAAAPPYPRSSGTRPDSDDAPIRREHSTTMNDVKISIGEVLEVRDGALDPAELLAVAAQATDKLPPCPRGKCLFDVDHVFISEDGTISIEPVNSAMVDSSYIPPEWALGQSDDMAAAVYCMGAVMRQAGAEQTADADLFSLVNILTVAMIGTRPTPTRMGQMAKNQLKGEDPRQVLQAIYMELMGDEMENQLSDDYSEEDFDIDTPSGVNGRASRTFQNEDEHVNNDFVPAIGNGIRNEPPRVEPVSPGIIKRAAITTEISDDDFEDGLSEEDELAESSSDEERRPQEKVSTSTPKTEQKPPPIHFEEPQEMEDKRLSSESEEASVAPVPAVKLTSERLPNPFGDNFSDHHFAHSADDVIAAERDEESMDDSGTVPQTSAVNGRTFVKEPEVTVKDEGPFDQEDEISETNLTTLSGRDPFQNETQLKEGSPSKSRNVVPNVSDMLGASISASETVDDSKKLQHRFSSEDDDIVEARISDEELFPPAKPTERRKSYFEDVMEEIQSKEEKDKHKHDSWSAATNTSTSALSTVAATTSAANTHDSRGRTPASSTSSSVSPVSSMKEDDGPGYTSSPEPVRRNDLHNDNKLIVKQAIEEKERKAGMFEKKRSRAEIHERRNTNPFDEETDESESSEDQISAPPRRRHVEPEVVVASTPTPPTRRSVLPKQVEPVKTQEEEDDLDAAFEVARKAREEKLREQQKLEQQKQLQQKKLQEQQPQPTVKPATPVLPPPALLNGANSISSSQNTPQFSRRNSLQPSRVSGRRSTRSMRKRKTRAEPEFVEKKSQPCIRLKAPFTKRKKMSLHRVEDVDLWVELLNGQRIEVSCRSDALAQDIFSLVVGHLNINEHVFFGLSVMRDGEHFFLDDNQKVEKFAPPGWKSGGKSGRNQYVLSLRFRFYPQILDFIKTEVTVHELYLQLRRDVLEDRLQPKRDSAFELAALALQAEFGDRPPPAVVDYFSTEYYLHKRFYGYDDVARVQKTLGELHSHYQGMKTRDAECRFIQICQTLADFGAHLHRVFRSKPSAAHAASPFDPDTGANMYIAIMPKGILVQEEQGGVRQTLAQHVWQRTQTLQFDKKKFIIVAVEGSDPTETVFYSDHYTKAAYFVRFAASQHRFMMRMRQWKNTLRSERTIAAHPDVAVEGTLLRHNRQHDVPPASPLDSAEMLFPKIQPRSTKPEVLDVSMASQNRTVDHRMDETTTTSFNDRLERAAEEEEQENIAGTRFNMILNKDPNAGLGLTLVDSTLNDVAGVYVKAGTPNGAGDRCGLMVGDRLLSVNGTSLINADRHRAVDLVKASGPQVRLEIARWETSGSFPVSHSKQLSSDSVGKPPLPKISNTSVDGTRGAARLGVNNAAPIGASRTPPAPRKVPNKRQRAVSDFGAIGDMLPAFNSEDIMADKMRAISGLHLDDSDEERGEYRLPTHSMYQFDNHDDEQPAKDEKETKQEKSLNDSYTSERLTMSPASGAEKRKYNYNRKSNLDWTEDLEELGEEVEDEELLNVELLRNESGSLGIQIASVKQQVCIKQITAEPALSANIEVGDVLVAVNDVTTANKTHQDVVQMLRSGGQRVRLALRRDGSAAKERTIRVVLRKPEGGSLGLSLAKRTGFEGIYVRMIGANSAAELDGTLKVGDRIWEMDGVNVADSSPSVIVEKLKNVDGLIDIVVKRPTE